MTLRRKFMVVFAALAAGVAVLVGSIGFGLTTHNLHSEITQSLVTAASTLSTGGNLGVPGTNAGTPDSRMRDSDQGTIQAAQVITRSGAVTPIFGSTIAIPVDDRASALAGPGVAVGTRIFEKVRIDGTAYEVLTQTLGDGRGAIQVARDLSEADRVLGRLALATALLGLAVLVVAALVGALVARQITRRLTSLTAAAERVSSTRDLGQEIPAKGKDEVGRLGSSLQSMLAELARSRDDQQRLVQNAGHELRTPLTSLRTNIRVLRRFAELPPDSQRRLLDDVDGETRELTNLVNELVDLASDRWRDEKPEAVDLAVLAEGVAALFRRRSGRQIVVDAEPAQATVRPHAVIRAVSNLLDNAVKFAQNQEPITITVCGNRIEVLDRGPGLAAEDTDRIFDRFYRATSARSLPGSGLGLSIVREVAAQHGGAVRAAARPGGGAAIGFTVADQKLAAGRPASPTATGDPEPSAPTADPARR